MKYFLLAFVVLLVSCAATYDDPNGTADEISTYLNATFDRPREMEEENLNTAIELSRQAMFVNTSKKISYEDAFVSDNYETRVYITGTIDYAPKDMDVFGLSVDGGNFALIPVNYAHIENGMEVIAYGILKKPVEPDEEIGVIMMTYYRILE
jgi:hypothetical protein